MATLEATSTFFGPLPGTDSEYVLRVTLNDHHPFRAIGAESTQEEYPFMIEANPIPTGADAPREAFVKIICPKLRKLDFTVRDLEDPQSALHEMLEPVPLTENDTLPDTFQEIYDLTEGEADPNVDSMDGNYSIQPGRRTRTLMYD